MHCMHLFVQKREILPPIVPTSQNIITCWFINSMIIPNNCVSGLTSWMTSKFYSYVSLEVSYIFRKVTTNIWLCTQRPPAAGVIVCVMVRVIVRVIVRFTLRKRYFYPVTRTLIIGSIFIYNQHAILKITQQELNHAYSRGMTLISLGKSNFGRAWHKCFGLGNRFYLLHS